MENILEVQALSKYYGKLCALNNVHLTIPKGSVFGLLGPNGSGKTTFLGIITNVLRSHSGNFSWFNQGEKNQRNKIGTLLETPNFYPYLSAYDNLLIDAATKECSSTDIESVLKTVALDENKAMLFKRFSLGMKQRLAIASALLGHPEVVILDEPTNGLDPVGIADIRNMIIKMGESGKTVIIASHLLGEIQKVCTHVAILKKGNILSAGPVEQVLSSDEIIEVRADDLVQLKEALQSCSGVKSIVSTSSGLKLTLQEGFSLAELNTFCFEQQIVLTQLHKENKNLELKFLEITNQPKT